MKILVLLALCSALAVADQAVESAPTKSSVAEKDNQKRGVAGVGVPQANYQTTSYVQALPSIETQQQHITEYLPQVAQFIHQQPKYQYIQKPQVSQYIQQHHTKLQPSQQYVVEDAKATQQYVVAQPQVHYQPQYQAQVQYQPQYQPQYQQQYFIQDPAATQQQFYSAAPQHAANYLIPQHQQPIIMMVLPAGLTQQQGLAYLGGPQGQQQLLSLLSQQPAQQYAYVPQHYAQPQPYATQPQPYATQPQPYTTLPQEYAQYAAPQAQLFAAQHQAPQQPANSQGQAQSALRAAQQPTPGVVYAPTQGHQGGSQQTRTTPAPVFTGSAGNYGQRAQRSQKIKN